ncbi:MAG: MFS transporter [Rhodospirillaceae bacterium]|nr:MFS transporter [Rhodospirillaceae bacterium]
MSLAVHSFFQKTAKIESHELRAILVSFVYLFCLMASYYTMRPLRDALASEVASEDLKFLWTGTFVASTLAALVFGWVVSRFKISSCLPWIYGFFIINIGIFYVLMGGYPLGSTDTMTAPVLNAWPVVLAPVKVSTVVASVYYVWLSVFNMFVVSVFWSFLADRYSKDQSKRLFGFVAAGGSAGAALGPLATAAIVNDLGVENMLLISAIVLSITIFCIRDLNQHTTGGQSVEAQLEKAKGKVGGSSWSGFATLFKDPYLMAIAVFVMLYTFISTIFYVAQVDLVRAAFETREARYAVNAIVDGIVNGLAIFTQLFVTSRIAGRWGMVFLLACMPAFMIFAFFALSAFPVLMMILSLQVVRRAGNYAMTRPGREMLWTVVDRDRKYKAKNVVDTSVYRGADLINIWIENGLRSAGFGLAQIALVGSGVAAAWCGVSVWLGKTAEKRKTEHPGSAS